MSALLPSKAAGAGVHMTRDTVLVRELRQRLGEREIEIARLKREVEELRGAIAALLAPPTCGESVKDPDMSGRKLPHSRV